MSRTKRTVMKNYVIAAVGHCEAAMDRIASLGLEFDGVKPELHEGLELAARLIHTAQETLETFYQNAWGTNVPPDRLG